MRMKNLSYWISKLLIPALFAIAGLIMLLSGLKPEKFQSSLYLFSGFFMVAASIVWALLVVGKLSMPWVRKYAALLFIPAIFVMGGIVYSIRQSIRFEEIKTERENIIKNRLMKIREAQLAYKEVKGEYADNFIDLIDFLKNGKTVVVKVDGNIDDTLAVAQGRVKIDSIWVPILGLKFIETFPLDSLKFVPFAMDPETKQPTGEQFILEAGKIETPEGLQVPVFAASTNYGIFLEDLLKEYGKFSMDSVIQVGSMTEPNTNGSWRN
jgi:hypothetical protein